MIKKMLLLVWTNSSVCSDNAKPCLALNKFVYMQLSKYKLTECNG